MFVTYLVICSQSITTTINITIYVIAWFIHEWYDEGCLQTRPNESCAANKPPSITNDKNKKESVALLFVGLSVHHLLKHYIVSDSLFIVPAPPP
jgi:hypothetical protein